MERLRAPLDWSSGRVNRRGTRPRPAPDRPMGGRFCAVRPPLHPWKRLHHKAPASCWQMRPPAVGRWPAVCARWQA